jgi:hypothetical protein
VIILRFEGGPCDGREERSATVPARVVRSPGAQDFLRSLNSADRDARPVHVMRTYALVEIDEEGGFAIYRPLE